jgi:ATP-binding cassette, subfamily B, multidrug efflux pump
MALLILIGRPPASFTQDFIVQQAIAPGMTNLIRWQTHRYVLRQSVCSRHPAYIARHNSC